MSPMMQVLAVLAVAVALLLGLGAVLRAAPDVPVGAGAVFVDPRVVRVVDGDTFDIEVYGQVERVRPTMLDAVERGHRDHARATEALAQVLHGARGLRIEVVKLDRWGWGKPRRPRLIARVTARWTSVPHLDARARVPLGVALVGMAIIDGEEAGRMPWAIPYVPALRKVWKELER